MTRLEQIRKFVSEEWSAPGGPTCMDLLISAHKDIPWLLEQIDELEAELTECRRERCEAIADLEESLSHYGRHFALSQDRIAELERKLDYARAELNASDKKGSD